MSKRSSSNISSHSGSYNNLSGGSGSGSNNNALAAMGSMGILGGSTTPLYYPGIPPPSSSTNITTNPACSRDGQKLTTTMLVVWAVLATFLWIYQVNPLAVEGNAGAMGTMDFAKTTQTACVVEHKWNGGSPLDTYHGSCYCGNDKYCMVRSEELN